MYIVIYGLAILIGIIVLLILIAPKKYQVSRSIVIDKPVSEVFQYIKQVKNQDHWSPWQKRDPNMKKTLTGVDGEVGFTTRWESDHKQVGHGEQEIKSIIENERMESELRFLKPFKSVSNGYFTTEAEGNGTKVTWGFYGTHKVPVNVMMMFFNMDKAVGKDFEEGLTDLKAVLEK
ncbi:MAG: SRPBCC family protein [Bacteroidetes bacterium]|nr:SRPBCC family protein [Bacteroidota bacterium]